MATHVEDFFERMKAAGLLPPDTRRVVIDIQAEEAVRVYYDCFADKKMLDCGLLDLLKEAVIVREKT